MNVSIPTPALHVETCSICGLDVKGTPRSAYLSLGTHILRAHEDVLIRQGALVA